MNQSSYREAIKHSFILVWKNKSFWIFGILSALFISPFGMGAFWGNFLTVGQKNLKFSNFPIVDFFRTLSQSSIPDFVSLTWILIIFLAILTIIIFISVCAQTSLMFNVCEYYKKKKYSKLSITWNKSYKYFWKILSYDLLRKVFLVFTIALSAGLWSFAFKNNFWTLLFLILSFTAIILLSLTVSSITAYASGFAIIDNKNFWDGIKKGALLFKEHFLISLEISLIMLILDLVLASIISTIVILVFIPAAVLWFIAGLFNSLFLLNFFILLIILTITILVVLIGGFYNAFNTGTWMYLFMKMRHEGIFSRFGQFFTKFFQK